jgi:hypothetical protein
MASYNKFHIFVQNMGRGVHNLNTDTLKAMLSNTAPAQTNQVKADITEISAGNGYSAGGSAPGSTSYAQTSGTGKLAGNDVTFTASGGSIGPFRYIVLYDDTPTSPADPLMGWWDYGSNVTLNSGDSFTVDFADNTAIIAVS